MSFVIYNLQTRDYGLVWEISKSKIQNVTRKCVIGLYWSQGFLGMSTEYCSEKVRSVCVNTIKLPDSTRMLRE